MYNYNVIILLSFDVCVVTTILTCPVILDLCYVVAIRCAFILLSRVFAIFSINMSVQT